MLKIFFIFLILPIHAMAALRLTNGFFAWRETSGDNSTSSYLLDLRLGLDVWKGGAIGVISETDYYKDKSDFYGRKSLGGYVSQDMGNLGFSLAYLPSVNVHSTTDLEHGIRFDAYQFFTIRPGWRVGPRLTFRNYFGDRDLNSLKPTLFSEVSF